MKRIVKDLCVITDKYVDKSGQHKNRYKNIGVEITEIDGDGKENSYLLLDKTVCLAGFQNFSDKPSDRVLVSKFAHSNKTASENENASLDEDLEEVF